MMSQKKQQGLSIIEVLVGLAISIIIAVAILGIFTNTLVSSQRVLEKGKLDLELQAIMDIIVSDVQRSGYWLNATTSKTNPFMSDTDDITVNAGSDCVTYTYDLNADGTVQDNERFGFRKNGNNVPPPSGGRF